MSHLDHYDIHHPKFIQSLVDIANILKKPLDQRTAQENDLIVSTFIKIPFFANYARLGEHSKQLLLKLPSIVRLERCPAMSIIYHHNDLARKFCVILKGDARRYVPRDPEDIENELLETKLSPKGKNNDYKSPGDKLGSVATSANNSKPKTILSLGNIPNESHPKSIHDINHKEPGSLIGDDGGFDEILQKNYYQSSPAEIAFFKSLNMPKKYFLETALKYRRAKGPNPGDHFGEMGLAVSVPNDSTLVAWEDVYLASIEKKDYEQVFGEIVEETRSKLSFLTQNLLPGLPSKISLPFALGFSKEIYRAGEKIFQQGMKTRGFWVIREGEIELFRTMKYKNDKPKPGENEESPGKKKTYKALIVRLSPGQILGEEMLIGIKQRVFTAVGKLAYNVLYFYDENSVENFQESTSEVMAYLAGQGKTSMEGKMQRLNDAMIEAQIILASDENINKTGPNRAKETIDGLMPGGKVTSRANNKDDKGNQLNSKKAYNVDQATHDVEEWTFLEKLAEVKQKVLLAKTKIDPKLLGDKSVDKEIEAKGYNERPDRTNEMTIAEKKFYYPQSLYQFAVGSDKSLIKRREILQFALLQGHPDLSKDGQSNLLKNGIGANKSVNASIFLLNSSTQEKESLNSSAASPVKVMPKKEKRKPYPMSPTEYMNNLKMKLKLEEEGSQNKNLDRVITEDISPLTPAPGSPFGSSPTMPSPKSELIPVKNLSSLGSGSSATKMKNMLHEMHSEESQGPKSPKLPQISQIEEEKGTEREGSPSGIDDLKHSLRAYLSYSLAHGHRFHDDYSPVKVVKTKKEKVGERQNGSGFLQFKPMAFGANMQYDKKKNPKMGLRLGFVRPPKCEDYEFRGLGMGFDISDTTMGDESDGEKGSQNKKVKLPLLAKKEIGSTSRRNKGKGKQKKEEGGDSKSGSLVRKPKRNSSLFN